MKLELDKKALLKVIMDISLKIKKQIRDRTANGIDMDGKPFKPYSEIYLQQKADYQSKGKVSMVSMARASNVNLMLTGTMMRSKSMEVRQDPGKLQCEIFFPDKPLAIRAWTHHTGAGKMPQRKFFGVSKDEESKIYNKYMNPARDKVARIKP